MHFMSSKNLTNKKQKICSKKQKGCRDGMSYSTPQKSEETRGNAITKPWSYPIPKFYIFLMGPPLMYTTADCVDLANSKQEVLCIWWVSML